MGQWIGRRYVYSSDEQAEYREKMQRENEKAFLKHLQKWITPSRLKSERNWTDSAINKFLSRHRPTETKTKYGTKLEYRMSSILKVEAKPEFSLWMEKRIATQTRKKTILIQ